jgi:hypothetical protein
MAGDNGNNRISFVGTEVAERRLQALRDRLAEEADDAQRIAEAEERGFELGRRNVLGQLQKIRDELHLQVRGAETVSRWVELKHKRAILDELLERLGSRSK